MLAAVHTTKQTNVRKRRSDRNHLIYRVENSCTGDFYIGVTVAVGRGHQKSLLTRWKRHVYKAVKLGVDWEFSAAIREHGESAFRIEMLEVVRGKAEAFQRETQLINALRPAYNTRMKAC